MPFSASLGGNDGDLDQQARIGELGLDASAAGKVLTLGPRVPGFVHGIAKTDVGHPDGGGYLLIVSFIGLVLLARYCVVQETSGLFAAPPEHERLCLCREEI